MFDTRYGNWNARCSQYTEMCMYPASACQRPVASARGVNKEIPFLLKQMLLLSRIPQLWTMHYFVSTFFANGICMYSLMFLLHAEVFNFRTVAKSWKWIGQMVPQFRNSPLSSNKSNNPFCRMKATCHAHIRGTETGLCARACGEEKEWGTETDT